MSKLLASGGNYAVELEGSCVYITVWRAPEMDSAEGARAAPEILAQLRPLLRRIDGVVLDLRAAPAVAGPRTVESVSETFRLCDEAGVHLAVLVSQDPMQQLQMQRLVSTYAARHGKVFTAEASADAWATTPRRP